MRSIVLATGLLLASSAAPVPAQDDAAPGRLAVELNPSAETRVGDRVPARLVLEWTGPEIAAEGPRFPVWDSGWGAAEVLEAGDVESFTDQAGRRIHRQELVLTAFETGEIRLPPRTVAVPTTEGDTVELETEEARFEVVSVLPPEGSEEPVEPRPPAPLAELPGDLRFPAAAAAATALLLAALAFAFFRVRRQAPLGGEATRRPLRPPLEELELALDAADPRGPADALHVAISTGLRRYLWRAAGLPALESTTTELRRRLLSSPVPEEATHGVVQLLRACDQVKFARGAVPPERAEERVHTARRLARTIEHALRPAPAPGTEAA